MFSLINASSSYNQDRIYIFVNGCVTSNRMLDKVTFLHPGAVLCSQVTLQWPNTYIDYSDSLILKLPATHKN